MKEVTVEEAMDSEWVSVEEAMDSEGGWGGRAEG